MVEGGSRLRRATWSGRATRWAVRDIKKPNSFREWCLHKLRAIRRSELTQFYDPFSCYFRMLRVRDSRDELVDVGRVLSPVAVKELLRKATSFRRPLKKLQNLALREEGLQREVERQAQAVRMLKESGFIANRDICRLVKITQRQLAQCLASNYDPRSLLTRAHRRILSAKNELESHQKFMAFFNRVKAVARSGAELHRLSQSKIPEITPPTLQSFRRTRLNPLGIRKKVCKHMNHTSDSPTVRHNRVLFLKVFKDLALDGVEMVFFDESLFQVRQKNLRAFELPGQRPTFFSRSYPIFVKLTLMCSFTRVLGFEVSDQKTTAASTANFFREFVKSELAERRRRPRRVVVVLDNGPKNKSKEIEALAQSGSFELFFTIPNSPFLNFVENIFHVVKQRVYQAPEPQRLAS